MGKKRRNNDHAKNAKVTGDTSSQSGGGDDDEISFRLAITYLYQNKFKVLMLMVIGFCIGSGSGAYMTVNPSDPNRIQTAYQRWASAVGKQAPFSFGSARSGSRSGGGGRNGSGGKGKDESEIDDKRGWRDWLLNGKSLVSFYDPNNIYDKPYKYIKVNGKSVRDDPSHPITFAMLREAVIRREGGFVHPDLGVLTPAPCGAARGIGMIRDSYNKCQTRCVPGILSQKLAQKKYGNHDEIFPPFWNADAKDVGTKEKLLNVIHAQEAEEDRYRQEEILMKIPLNFQMTRILALKTLKKVVPNEVNMRAPLQELDDAALLVLLLAHERGLGRASKFEPYIKSLPVTPSCGYAPSVRAQALDTITTMGVEFDMDVFGWPGELGKASDRAMMIADGLAKDYGQYIETPKGTSAFSVIQWALCQVASRATAGSDRYGALRMVPIIDMINHDINGGSFIELAGNERLENNNIIDATETDRGAFVVRSIRHGRRIPLKKGQELLANYNVHDYSPLDWFLSLGFIPPERMKKWHKIDGHFKKPRSFVSDDL